MTQEGTPVQAPGQRIFISYRRDDTQWVAGRLADSLSAYFGDQRVFRDIDGIVAGERFGDVIENTLGAADAVVVLIGKRWLDASDADGKRRLASDDDWVAQEVSAALKLDIPVYPVLVDDAPMPRNEELPGPLQALTRHNAISISDARWHDDVARLARIMSLDIPSATERKLRMANLLISGLLFLAVALTMTIVVDNLLDRSGTVTDWTLSELTHWADAKTDRSWLDRVLSPLGGDDTELEAGRCANPPKAWLQALIGKGLSGLAFLLMVPASVLMFVLAPHVDPARRRFFYAAAWTGALGSFTTFMLFLPVCSEYETIVNFYLGVLFATLMLAFMSLSGFKAK
jgi:hypothetical protein